MAEGDWQQVLKRNSVLSTFKSYRIFTDYELGRGSYAAVYKTQCDDIVCATKFIHEVLINSSGYGSSSLIEVFERECDLLASFRHPNIVQYMGKITHPSTHQPGLVTELMDGNLTQYLEHSSQPLPYHLQVSICHDIALALSYLHAQKIVHRDISSNCILLKCDGLVAKLSNFDIATTNLRSDLEVCPGARIFMPPEALIDPPTYTEKIDCFSFGVVIFHILTRLFPIPDRRQKYLQEIDHSHPLLPIMEDCLKDEGHRPSAHQLCMRIEALKETSMYTKSKRSKLDPDQELQEQLQSERKQHDFEQQHNREEIHRLRNEIKQKEERIAIEREAAKRLSQLQTELSQSQHETRQLQQELTRSSAEYRQQLQQQQLQTSQKEHELVQGQRQILNLQQRVDGMNVHIRAKDNQIQQLQQRLEAALDQEELRSRLLSYSCYHRGIPGMFLVVKLSSQDKSDMALRG